MEPNTEKKKSYIVVAVDYTPGSISSPAFLDVALEDHDAPSGVRTQEFRGKAAKRFSTLAPGDIFEEKDRE